jgi:hypothetical protein
MCRGRRFQQRSRVGLHLAEPRRPIVRADHDRHAVVQRRHLRVRARGDDGESPLDLAAWRAPTFPDTAQCQGLAVRAGDRVGLLAAPDCLPFIERRGRDQATSACEGAAVHRRGGDRLGAGVDRPARVPGVLGEIRQQAPAEHIQMPLAGIRVPPYHQRRLAGSKVPRRRQVRQRVGRAEQPRDGLGGQEGCIAAAHDRNRHTISQRQQASSTAAQLVERTNGRTTVSAELRRVGRADAMAYPAMRTGSEEMPRMKFA